MTAPPPRRPWWKKTRTWAAVVAWLILPVLYLLSAGPAWRAAYHGRIEVATYDAVYGPASALLGLTPFLGLFDDYVSRWGPADFVGGDDAGFGGDGEATLLDPSGGLPYPNPRVREMAW